MSISVSVPALYDGSGVWLNGQLVGVRKDAFVIGTTTKPLNPFDSSAGTYDTLTVKDKILGTMYLKITKADWERSVNKADDQVNRTLYGEGDAQIRLEGGIWLASIAIDPQGEETISIGTTPGGHQIAGPALYHNHQYTSVIANKFFPDRVIIYFTGASGKVTYQLLTSGS